MAEAPKLTPEQQRTLDGLRDALEGVAVARRLVAAQEGAHA